MTPARCPVCEEIIGIMRGHGYQYTARQEGSGPWTVAFMGMETRRGTGATLHEAIWEAGRC